MKRTRNLLIILILLILAGAVWYSYYSATFNGLLYNDSMDYASIGRNVARGEGFISAYITPLGLQYHGIPHPDPWRAPLWPLILGAVMKVLGYNDNVVAITSGLFFLLTVPLIYLLGRRLFNEKVGVGSAVVFTLSGLALHFSVSGLTEPLAAFFMCLWLYLLLRKDRQNLIGALVIGLVGGLFYLARYNALVFAPFVFLALLARSEERVKTGLCFVGGFSAAALPWFIRNIMLFGSPLFSLQKFEPVMFTASYPEYSLYMMMKKPNIADFFASHSAEIILKIKTGALTFADDFMNPQFTGVSLAMMAVFLVAVVFPLGKQARLVKLVVVGCFLTQLAALLVIHYIPRLFFVFTPFYIIFGFGLLDRLTQFLPNEKLKIVTGVIVLTGGCLVFSMGNLPDWGSKHTPVQAFKEFSPEIKAIADRSTRTDLILSNDGHLISWYGDRNACKIPYSPGMLGQLNSYQKAKYIFLSSRASWNVPEADREWQKIYWAKPKTFAGYRVQQVFKDGSVIYEKQ